MRDSDPAPDDDDDLQFWGFWSHQRISKIIKKEAARRRDAGKTRALNYSSAIRSLILRADRLTREAREQK